MFSLVVFILIHLSRLFTNIAHMGHIKTIYKCSLPNWLLNWVFDLLIYQFPISPEFPIDSIRFGSISSSHPECRISTSHNWFPVYSFGCKGVRIRCTDRENEEQKTRKRETQVFNVEIRKGKPWGPQSPINRFTMMMRGSITRNSKATTSRSSSSNRRL